MLDLRPGAVVFRVTGPEAASTFKDEAGGHRWQRIPPTERRGRVHTSTVTVAVLSEPSSAEVELLGSDLRWTAVRGTGAGGQHRNVTCSAVEVTHLPTGLKARCQSERSQHRNKAAALATLRARIWEARRKTAAAGRADQRRLQVGSGMRGDKRRTIRTQDDSVTDHLTGKTWTWRAYSRGNWE